MATGEEPRCADCLTEFGAGVSRFIVLKRDTSREFDDEERRMTADLYETAVCEDCSGWYRESFELEGR